MKIEIRTALAEDMPQVHGLVKELAVFERAPEEVITTPDIFVHDGFNQKLFEVIIAEDKDLTKANKIIGIAFYFWAYSTWNGRFIWLDDLVVTESYRQHGVGSLLFKQVITKAKSEGIRLIKWQVLDWNDPAIGFYKKVNAQHDSEWLTYRLSANQFDDILKT